MVPFWFPFGSLLVPFWFPFGSPLVPYKWPSYNYMLPPNIPLVLTSSGLHGTVSSMVVVLLAGAEVVVPDVLGRRDVPPPVLPLLREDLGLLIF